MNDSTRSAILGMCEIITVIGVIALVSSATMIELLQVIALLLMTICLVIIHKK